MSDLEDVRPSPALKPKEVLVETPTMGNLDAHLIADMLRIESMSKDIRTLSSKMDSLNNKVSNLDTTQIQHSAQTEANFKIIENSIEGLQLTISANEKRTSERFSKLEGWFFAIVGLAGTGLIAIITSIIAGLFR